VVGGYTVRLLLSEAYGLQDGAVAESSLEEAAARLRESISFSRGDLQPHNALGDALLACADRVSHERLQALSLLRAALDEGFSAALRLNGRDANALVGTAEVGFRSTFTFACRQGMCVMIRVIISHGCVLFSFLISSCLTCLAFCVWELSKEVPIVNCN
jgi:hypothetical protein